VKPKRVVVSGGTGFVGRFVVEAFLGAGCEVVVAARTPPAEGFFSHRVRHATLVLGEAPHAGLFDGVDCFVHAAFDHVPGKYRGGEGDDPEGFRRRNLDCSIAFFEAAMAAGVKTVVFLSSRAVYGTQPSGAVLTEETPPHPNTLYGEIKLAAERHLLSMASADFRPIVLRVTGVYGVAGHSKDHKWSGLIDDYLAGRPASPRVATEVHGADLAEAVLLLTRSQQAGVFNVSDIVVDRRDVLAIVKELSGCRHVLPARADAGALHIMATVKLRSLGWQPGGLQLFEQTVRQMAQDRGSHSDSTRSESDSTGSEKESGA
jgi:nucleoside-diphosphate-sugar epimerase